MLSVQYIRSTECR